MKHRYPFFSALLLAFLSSPVLSAAPTQGEAYVGGGFSLSEYKEDVSGMGFVQDNLEVDQNLINARIGYFFADYLAIETRFGTGLGDESGRINSASNPSAYLEADMSTNWLVGAYGVGHIPVGERFSIYGLAGVAHLDYDVDLTSNVNGASGSTSDSWTEFSYGAGAQFAVTDSPSAYGEWVRYGEDGGDKLEGMGFGVLYHY